MFNYKKKIGKKESIMPSYVVERLTFHKGRQGHEEGSGLGIRVLIKTIYYIITEKKKKKKIR